MELCFLNDCKFRNDLSEGADETGKADDSTVGK